MRPATEPKPDRTDRFQGRLNHLHDISTWSDDLTTANSPCCNLNVNPRISCITKGKRTLWLGALQFEENGVVVRLVMTLWVQKFEKQHV